MSAYSFNELYEGTLVSDLSDTPEGKRNIWWTTKGHFAGYVPVEKARELLTVNVKLIEPNVTVLGDDGVTVADTSRFRAVVDADTGYVFQMAGADWKWHPYTEWLLDNVGMLLSASAGELQIGSVIALGHKEKAVVQVRPATGIEVGGFRRLPWIAAFTSLDASWASTYKPCHTDIVCDNTAAMAFGERTKKWSTRHTKNSAMKIGEARKAIDLFFSSFDEMAAEMEKLMNVQVSEKHFGKILDYLFPIDGTVAQRGATRRQNVKDAISGLYHHDNRCSPWAGTAFGVVQTVNTFHHHLAPVWKSNDRVDRQAANLVTGETEKVDAKTIEAINAIFADAGLATV